MSIISYEKLIYVISPTPNMLFLMAFARVKPGYPIKPGPIRPPWDPTKNRTMDVMVQCVDSETGQGIPDLKVTIGYATLTTNAQGRVNYQYSARKPQKYNVSVAESTNYPAGNGTGTFRITIRLKSKIPTPLGPSIKVVDEVTMKPIQSVTCNISVDGKLLGVFTTNKDGIIQFKLGQVTAGQQVDLKLNLRVAYSKDIITIKMADGINIAKVQRVVSGLQQCGFAIYDNVTKKRIPTPTFVYSTPRGSYTLKGDKNGIVMLESTQENKLWSQDMVKVVVSAPGYKDLVQEFMFPGFPMWTRWFMIK